MLPCTGRIEEAILLHAFEGGADGVMVIGCLEGDCHYINGNIRAKARVARVIKILEEIGIGGARLRMFNLSAGEGAKFALFANEFAAEIGEHGPSIINTVRRTTTQAVSQEA